MKKYIFTLLMLFLGCSSTEPSVLEPPTAAEDYLLINPVEFAVQTGGGAQNITVIANTKWTVSHEAEWLNCSANSGIAGNGNVSITATANYTGTARSAELTFTAGTMIKKCIVSQTGEILLSVSKSEVSIPADGGSQIIVVTSDTNWEVSSNVEWCLITPKSGAMGNRNISITAAANYTGLTRSADLTFTAGAVSAKCIVSQESTEMPDYVPEGYTLVWQDEFNDPRTADGKVALPGTDKWWFETGASGWGNNEIQNYIPRFLGQDTCAKVYDGTLKIIAKKVGSQVLSIRMNSNESWTYGYFEARMKLPSGKGTWPALWMLPENFVRWPDDGEIDIMEHVGYDPNRVHSTVHTRAYNHIQGTQRGASRMVPTAQSDFHIYAVEWTEDYIYGFVDGVRYFVFNNDKTGNKNTWPFNVPFYLKLNLAWGGNWGGAQGIDESALPATYEIDYMRVYQRIEN